MSRISFAVLVILLAGCGGKSKAEISVEAMKKCEGTVSVSITLGTLWSSLTMHCDRMSLNDKKEQQ